jgi:hypothetical protein
MYISLLVHYIEQSTFFLSSAVLPHPRKRYMYAFVRYIEHHQSATIYTRNLIKPHPTILYTHSLQLPRCRGSVTNTLRSFQFSLLNETPPCLATIRSIPASELSVMALLPSTTCTGSIHMRTLTAIRRSPRYAVYPTPLR